MENQDDKKVQKEVLWGLFQEYRSHARHKEVMRANITNYVLLISAGLLTLVSADGIERNDFPLTIMLVAVGLVGAVFNNSYTERYLRNRERAEEITRRLGEVWFGDPETVRELRDAADSRYEASDSYYRITRFTNAHVLWLLFPLLVSAIGLVLTVIALKGK